jgi:hypothetical protein
VRRGLRASKGAAGAGGGCRYASNPQRTARMPAGINPEPTPPAHLVLAVALLVLRHVGVAGVSGDAVLEGVGVDELGGEG